jgi:MtaA/CmuA family methyltransferase
MGAKVGATNDQQPFGGMGEPVIKTAADIDRIPAPDIGRQGRCPLMLEALTCIVRALGREVFVVACFDQYPFSLAAALMGINEIMFKIVDDPPFVSALMARCEEFGLAYASALGAAGADMLSGGDSPAVLIGPQLYQQIVLPAETSLIRKLKRAAGKPVSLHICGNTTRILPLMASSGADVLELDHAVNLEAAFRVVAPAVAIWGNLDPVRVLAQGTPEEVTSAAGKAVAAARTAGHFRFVLSSGCTLAVETPAANLDALMAVSRDTRCFQ